MQANILKNVYQSWKTDRCIQIKWIIYNLHPIFYFIFNTWNKSGKKEKRENCRKLSFLCVLSHVPLLGTPWTAARQNPLSMGFPPQEYWSGLPFPTLGDLPTQGFKPHLLCLLHWLEYFLPRHHQFHPSWYIIVILFTITNYIVIEIPLFPCMSKQTKMINLTPSYRFHMKLPNQI